MNFLHHILKLTLFVVALFAFAAIGIFEQSTSVILGALLALIVCAQLLTRQTPSAYLRVTLSVPELLLDVIDAFRLEIFPISMFSLDFSSVTAVKGDIITAHIATIPTTNTVDPTTGFANGATAAENLLVDIPVTLNQLRHCPVVVKFLSQIQSKMPLYRESTRNTGYALAKYALDYCLQQVLNANFKHKETIAAPNFNLDSLETIRTDLNTQKAKGKGRFGIINSTYANSLQNDDRVKSALFYAQLNGDTPFRVWRNICGFEKIIEYPDMPSNGENLTGFFGDNRAVVLAARQIAFANVAAELGVPQIMQFIPMTDPETGLTMTGVGWQDTKTGDVTFSPAILFGVSAGDQGGAQDSITGAAAVRVVSA